MRKLLLATAVSMAMLTAAHATEIGFGPGNNNFTFTSVGTPGSLDMTSPAQTGVASFGTDTGTFNMTTIPTVLLSNLSNGTFNSVGANTETFSYSGADGDSLQGSVHITSVLDQNVNADVLIGSLMISSISGDPAFLANFASGNATFHWTINGDGLTTLAGISNDASGTTSVLTTSTGEINPVGVPTPIMGTGPLMVPALGGLWALLRYRRKKSTATLPDGAVAA